MLYKLHYSAYLLYNLWFLDLVFGNKHDRDAWYEAIEQLIGKHLFLTSDCDSTRSALARRRGGDRSESRLNTAS